MSSILPSLNAVSGRLSPAFCQSSVARQREREVVSVASSYVKIIKNSSSVINFTVSNTHSLGQVLYTDYIHVFQLSGMILLVAMIGAIVLTFRQRTGVKKQSYIKQISRERSEGVQVLEVETNKGVKIDD